MKFGTSNIFFETLGHNPKIHYCAEKLKTYGHRTDGSPKN